MPLFFVFGGRASFEVYGFFVFGEKNFIKKIKNFLKKSIDKIDDIVYNVIES